MSNKLLLITFISVTLVICLSTKLLLAQHKTVSVKKPPIHLFLDEHGNITQQAPEIETMSVVPEITNVQIEVTGESDKPIISTKVETAHSARKHAQTSHEKLIYLTDSEAWNLLTDGAFTSYPKQPFGQIRNEVQTIYNNKRRTITVPVWYWANPNDDTDFSKVTKFYEWTVNEEIADLCIEIFNAIYADPSQPIINLADSGMGTWSVRGKLHRDDKTVSAHALGASFDINPSTGSFNVNGIVYGNAYNNKPMPQEIWEQLPESHKKYHVLYVDSPIVSIFKQYGFYWGGDWHSSFDCMHLAFLGDGTNAREIGQSNYERYNQ